MSDLISKKAVMEELLAIQDVTYMSTCLTVDECKGKRWMIARAIDAVKDAPIVDAEPVKHGHWVTKKTAAGATYTVCSNCNTSVKYNDEYGTVVMNLKGAPRCPNCGAKMDEEVIE